MSDLKALPLARLSTESTQRHHQLYQAGDRDLKLHLTTSNCRAKPAALPN